jgi:cytidine deaminase
MNMTARLPIGENMSSIAPKASVDSEKWLDAGKFGPAQAPAEAKKIALAVGKTKAFTGYGGDGHLGFIMSSKHWYIAASGTKLSSADETEVKTAIESVVGTTVLGNYTFVNNIETTGLFKVDGNAGCAEKKLLAYLWKHDMIADANTLVVFGALGTGDARWDWPCKSCRPCILTYWEQRAKLLAIKHATSNKP